MKDKIYYCPKCGEHLAPCIGSTDNFCPNKKCDVFIPNKGNAGNEK